MKKNTLYFIIAALFLLNLFTIIKLNNLQNNINNRFQQNDYAFDSLRSDINNIYSNVDTKLKKQESILDKYNLTFGKLNPNNYTVPVTLSITPKEYSKGLTAILQLNNKTVPMTNDGTSFEATTDVYIFDDFQLKVNLEKDAIKKIETIEEYQDLRNKFLLEVNGGLTGQSSYGSKKYSCSGRIDLHFASAPSNKAEKISIFNDVNGTILSQQKVEPSNNVSIDVKDNVKLAAGDKLTRYAIVQDSYGLNYKYIIDVFEVDNNEKPVNNNLSEGLRRVSEITDRNGKIVYTPENALVK